MMPSSSEITDLYIDTIFRSIGSKEPLILESIIAVETLPFLFSNETIIYIPKSHDIISGYHAIDYLIAATMPKYQIVCVEAENDYVSEHFGCGPDDLDTYRLDVKDQEAGMTLKQRNAVLIGTLSPYNTNRQN